MTPVQVKWIEFHQNLEKKELLVAYVLTNDRKIKFRITSEVYYGLEKPVLNRIVTDIGTEINKQLKVAVPVGGGQWDKFQQFVDGKWSHLVALQTGNYPKPNLFSDDLAPHEERQPRVLHLIDIGDGMLVPKGFVEMILNDMPSVGALAYVDDFVKKSSSIKKSYESQYLQFPEIKGHQPGPDKQLIPKPTPGQTYKAFLPKIKKFL